MSDSYNHVVYGRVEVIQKYDSFWMARTVNGLKTVYEPDLTAIVVGEVIPLEPPSEVALSIDDPVQDTRINLNDSTYSAIAKGLPMVGRLAAKRIVERRDKQTDGRYFSFNQFKEVNSDLLDDADHWAILEPLVKFEE